MTGKHEPRERRTTTAALLLTDVVDSTKLSEALGDAAMAELWAKHDRVARDLLPVHDGREIDKTDGFLMLFGEASDAVAYAVAYHAALQGLGIAARAGLHVGEVILTENAPEDVALGAKPLEVDGIAKPTAARVMSVATGGQTLLTESARQSLGQTELRVESHGHWRMKGVSEPIELFEVGDEGAPFTPPPDAGKVYRVVEQGDLWLPVKQVKHSLPAERDAFVGRQADLRELSRRLDGDTRLVSVLGIGGTGKTRLVTRYGWTWLGDFPGGVWFCDLSEARSIEGIASAVARALDVPLGKGDPVVQLGHAIAGRERCLVLLDNFEQVARHAADTLGHWLDRAGEAQFVVTTREILGLPGEQALALAPLPAAAGSALFVARARAARRGFEPDDVESIDALVALLDGLPLAIELAAARVRVMPPAKLLDRMGQRFKLLASSGGRRDRQATLRATLDWSWDLLSGDEQSALAQLSVFEGGFTLDAAEAVLALDEAWPMDAVQGLVDKSLVRQVSDERFDLLVSVQEYAVEKLDAVGDRTETESRHGVHFASYGTDDAIGALYRRGGMALRRELARELDNLVVASQRSAARQDGEVAVDTAMAAWAILSQRGPFHAGIAILDAARAAATSDALCAVATAQLARALRRAGRVDEARTHYDAAVKMHREVGDRHHEVATVANLGMLHLSQGRMDEARAHYDAAVAVARELEQTNLEGQVLGALGILHLSQGRMDEARTHYDAALAIAREVGNRGSEGNMLENLGILHAQQGRMDEARTHFDAALAVHREVGDRRNEGNLLGNLGVLNLEQGRMDEARACFDTALTIVREVGDRRYEGIVRFDLGMLHLEQGRMDEARADLEVALAVHREVGDHYYQGNVLSSLAEVHLAHGRLDEAQACLDEGEPMLRHIQDDLALATLLSVRVRVTHAEGERAAARAALTEAEALADRVGAGPTSGIRGKLAQARADLEDR